MTSAATVWAQPSASALLGQMHQAEAHAHYVATVQFVRAGSSPMTMRVYRSGLQRRVEWTAPALLKGDLLVDNGQALWRYEKAENVAFKVRSLVAEEAVSHPAPETSKAKLVGSQTAAGRAAWVVSVQRPRGGQRKVWIDKATKVRLRSESYNAQGQRVELQSLQSVSFGTQPSGKFSFATPAGAEVTRTQGTLYTRLNAARKGATWLRAPEYVPAGYSFESAIVDPKGVAWLRYNNGVKRFSVFQEKGEGADVAPRTMEGGWFARKNGSRFGIIGAPDGTGQRIATSLK